MTDPVRLLAGGRRVSLLPRSGGHAFPATVAVSPDLLELEGVARLTDERHRSAVRAGSCSVAVSAADGSEHRVAATTVHTTGSLLRVDLEEGAVILRLGELSETDAAAIDRCALGRLGRPDPAIGDQRSGHV